MQFPQALETVLETLERMREQGAHRPCASRGALETLKQIPLTRTIEARLPAMPLEERERYFAVLSPLVARLEEIEKPLRQVFRLSAGPY